MDNNNFNDLNKFVKNSYDNNKLKLVKRKKIIIIFMNVISITCLIVGGIGLKSILDYKNDLKVNKNLQNNITDYKPTIINIEKEEQEKELEKKKKQAEINYEAFKDLIKINSDTVGWLKIKGTSIDIPIVKTVDNNYYLSHNFNKETNSLGWAFMDYRNNISSLDKNTIMYGHTYKDTLIFSSLTNVLKDDWLNNSNNYIIEFNTIYESHKWQVFSVYTEKKNNYYTKIHFSDNDKIITISTCYLDSNNRLVLHAKMIE